MTIAFVIFTASVSGYFLQISPGVVSQGLGGASIVIDEGLSAFHNPAISSGTQFSMIASKWLYSTSVVTASGCLHDFSCGISYINYGAIQGYDIYGNMTHTFTPFSLCAALSRKLGLFGISIKGFGERIETQTTAGACIGISTFTKIWRLGIGAKIDNLGREFTGNMSIPYTVGIGVRAAITDAVAVIIESKSPNIVLNGGVEYAYENVALLFGMKYLKPHDMVNGTEIGFRWSDLCYSGGIVVHAGAYAVGYAFVLHDFTTSHNLCIRIIPGQNR